MNYKSILQWWENKRKIYNFLLLTFGIFILLWDYNYYSNHPTLLDDSVISKIFFLLFWMIGANIFYCLGAGFDATCKYYDQDLTNFGRYMLYILGILISIIWTGLNLSSRTDLFS